MTDVSGSSFSPESDGAYRWLLGLPKVRPLLVAGLLARFPLSMLGLSSLLLVVALTGSYALAGAIGAALALSNAALAPALGRLVDRRSARPVLLVLSAAHGLAGVLFVLVVSAGAPTPATLAVAALTGATQPQVSAIARQRWTVILADDPRLASAHAVESVSDEIAFVVGPALAASLVTIFPQAGVIAALLFAVAAVPAFAVLPTPDLAPAQGPGLATAAAALPSAAAAAAVPAAAVPADAVPAAAVATSAERGHGVLRTPGMLLMVVAFVGIGGIFGAGEVSLVAIGKDYGWQVAAGSLPVVLTLTSLVSGLIYGARRWSWPLPKQLALAGVGLALATGLLALSTGVVLTVVAVALVGIPMAPALIGGNGLAGEIVAPDRRTEGFTWMALATSVGVAIFSPVAGHVVDEVGPRPATAVVAAAGAVVAIFAVAAAVRLRRRGSAQHADSGVVLAGDDLTVDGPRFGPPSTPPTSTAPGSTTPLPAVYRLALDQSALPPAPTGSVASVPASNNADSASATPTPPNRALSDGIRPRVTAAMRIHGWA